MISLPNPGIIAHQGTLSTPVVAHRYARMIPLVPGTWTSTNEWGLQNIEMSSGSGGTNLIPDATSTTSFARTGRTGNARSLLTGSPGPNEFAPNEMLESYWQVEAVSPILPTHVRHQARAAAFGSQAPIVFAWVYSTDGVNWLGRGIIDDSATGAYANDEIREYPLLDTAIPNTRSLARMWAIDTSLGAGPDPTYIIFGEVVLQLPPAVRL